MLSDRALYDAMNERLERERDWGAVLEDVHGRMRSREFKQYWMDIAVQRPRGGEYDVLDAHCFASFWMRVIKGEWLLAIVQTTGAPAMQGSLGNVRILRDLPPPFEGKYTTDTTLRWDARFEVGDGSEAAPVERFQVPPGSCPLLLGAQPAGAMLPWVTRDEMFARWPAGGDAIFIVAPRTRATGLALLPR